MESKVQLTELLLNLIASPVLRSDGGKAGKPRLPLWNWGSSVPASAWKVFKEEGRQKHLPSAIVDCTTVNYSVAWNTRVCGSLTELKRGLWEKQVTEMFNSAEKTKIPKDTTQICLGITQSCISKSECQRSALFNYDSFPYYHMKAIGTSKLRDRDHNLTDDHRKYSVGSKHD